MQKEPWYYAVTCLCIWKTSSSSSSSIDTATLVGFGRLNYRWVFSAGRFLQSAVASGTSNPQLGGPVIRTFQIPPLGAPTPETTPRILPKVATSTSLLGSFTCRKFTTWDRRLYFPSEGRRAEDFFARKIRRLWAGLNPRTRLPEASTLTSRPPKLPYERLKLHIYKTLLVWLNQDTWHGWNIQHM